MSQISRILITAAFALSATSCRHDGPVTYPVTGTVTLDGKPVESGEILFRSEGAEAATFAGTITGGKYELAATEGAKRVEISSMQKVPGKKASLGGTPGDPVSDENTADVYAEAVPAMYNAQSTLTASVTSGGPNEFKFDLKTSGN